MIEKFNGIIYLAVFIIHFVGYGVYAYRCVFGTQSFIDQYGMDKTGAIMTRFFGSLFIGSIVMALYIMFKVLVHNEEEMKKFASGNNPIAKPIFDECIEVVHMYELSKVNL